MKVIKCSINVSKITKKRLIRGEKGLYLNVTLLETPDNQYGNDYMIVEDVSKEEREDGKKGEILGNGKIFENEPKTATAEDIDKLPF